MKYIKYTIVLVIVSGLCFTGCDLGKSSDSDMGGLPSVMKRNDSNPMQKVTMVISSIPFPSTILDTLHYVHAPYISSLPNPVDNMSMYDQANAQAINLGIFGADLSYVISFEQFQQVGHYMKATKILADKAGIPLAFTASVFERCQKNSNNRDSLSRIVYESYYLIDQELKTNQRKSMQLLVLAGGWVEGAYLTTQSMDALTASTDRQGAYNVLLDQKQYLDLLLNQIDLINDSPYCQSISTSLHEIRGLFNTVGGIRSVPDTGLKALTEKISDLRIRIVKGGNA